MKKLIITKLTIQIELTFYSKIITKLTNNKINFLKENTIL